MTIDPEASGKQRAVQPIAMRILRLAPWVVFGPITGFFSEHAARALSRRAPWLALSYVLLNVAVLLAIPAVTAILAARLGWVDG